MNYVCITYANGRRVKYSYYPDPLLENYKKSGSIVSVRPLTRFERILAALFGSFTKS